MLWYLLAGAVVLLAGAVLGVAVVGTWRQTKELSRTVARAGESVATASTGLDEGLARLQQATPGRAPAHAGPPAASSRDGAALAARVERGRVEPRR